MTKPSMRRLRTCLVVFAIVAHASPAAAQVEFRKGPGPALGPFTEAVRVGDLLFLSGTIGTDSTGKLVAGGIGPETKQTLENIKAALARNGLDMDRVVKCSAFLADIAEWSAMNAVYVTFFPNNKPARTAAGGVQLVRQARVEIECIAAMR